MSKGFATRREAVTDVATFVLVHPAWFGGWCWKKVVAPLRDAGHTVFTPTLTGLGERRHLADRTVTLSRHVEDIVNVIEFEDLHDVTLVGNSSAGTVITAVADRRPHDVRHLVYLDAFVPGDGQSTRDLVVDERRSVLDALVESEGDGWLLPRFAPGRWEAMLDAWQIPAADKQWVLERLTPTPWGHFTEPVRLHNTGVASFRAHLRAGHAVAGAAVRRLRHGGAAVRRMDVP